MDKKFDKGEGRKDKKVPRLEGENVKKERIKERHKGACRNKKGWWEGDFWLGRWVVVELAVL